LPETKVWKTWRHFLAKVSASGCWFWTGILVLELCNEMCFPGRKCNKVFPRHQGFVTIIDKETIVLYWGLSTWWTIIRKCSPAVGGETGQLQLQMAFLLDLSILRNQNENRIKNEETKRK
jgi:hypothetical protein